MIDSKSPFTGSHIKRFMFSPVNATHGIGCALGGYDFLLIDGFDDNKYTLKRIEILTMTQNLEMISQIFTGSKDLEITTKNEFFKTDINLENRDPSVGKTLNPIRLDVGNKCLFTTKTKKLGNSFCIGV